MNEYKQIGGIVGSVLSLTGLSLSVTEIQAIVSIVATIVGIIITILSNVVIPFIIKWKKAKENDGKVTAEELEEIVKDTKENIEKTKNDLRG